MRPPSTPVPSALNRQSGALFGLDARIAMAVFALLALIAGYVAFGRIDIARQAALLADIQSIDEALQGYQADMGTFFLFTIDKSDNGTGAKDLEALWDIKRVLPGFRPHWNGPYLHRDTRQHRDYGRFSLIYAQSDRTNYCTTDSECYVWIALTKVPASKWNDINRAYDEGGGTVEDIDHKISSGRVQADADVDPRTLFLRSVSRIP